MSLPLQLVDPNANRPVRHRSVRRVDLLDAAAATVAGAILAMTVRGVLGWGSYLGAAIWGYIAFLVVFYLLSRDRLESQVATDRIVTALVWTTGLLVAAALGWMLVFLVARGVRALHPGFFTEDLSKVGPLNPGGGARHAIIGTLEQVGLATLIVVPLAVLTAVYLNEIRGRMTRVIRFVLDALAGLPSIVAGLFVFTIWVLKHGFSGASGGAALAILMLPSVTRASEEMLRTIPDSLREASLALGAPEWRVVALVVLPTALTGLVTATILGIARAVGETAPMLLTAFGTTTTNTNALHGPQADLPLFIWSLIRVPNAAQNNRAWTGALVLVTLVLVLFVSARVLAARSLRRLGRSS